LHRWDAVGRSRLADGLETEVGKRMGVKWDTWLRNCYAVENIEKVLLL
jgi:hypothetical protein